ncbi:hypothetical protein KC19_VG214600 [Ceratodon purpureus]|uniref:Uncharacterized protein n=1 Tax=Ceratodon purpureus TaxID=3225 RepID=A0A8T0HSN3_CERPU|nr:hypothetical protein KC19_VG214600 [Ceratodon purpureus]
MLLRSQTYFNGFCSGSFFFLMYKATWLLTPSFICLEPVQKASKVKSTKTSSNGPSTTPTNVREHEEEDLYEGFLKEPYSRHKDFARKKRILMKKMMHLLEMKMRFELDIN